MYKKILPSSIFLLSLIFLNFMAAPKTQQQVIILLGAPGAGKGTQAAILSQKLGLPHISTGDLFRENLRGNTPIGQKAKSYMERGALVPDEIVLEMLFDRISKPDAASGFILDGVPRTIAQAQVLDEKLKNAHLVVLNIDVPDSVIIERLAGRLTCEKCSTPYHMQGSPPKTAGICDRCGGTLIQRKDDSEEVIRKRLVVYHEQTAPLNAYYERQGRLVTVDGTQNKDKITENLLKGVTSFGRKKS